MKITSLTVGQIVYVVEKRKMGNTTMSTVDVRKVTITGVDPNGQWVTAKVGYAPERKYRERQVGKWRKSEPVLYRYPEGTFGHRMGIKRLATRAEIEAMKPKPTPRQLRIEEIERALKVGAGAFTGTLNNELERLREEEKNVSVAIHPASR